MRPWLELYHARLPRERACCSSPRQLYVRWLCGTIERLLEKVEQHPEEEPNWLCFCDKWHVHNVLRRLYAERQLDMCLHIAQERHYLHDMEQRQQQAPCDLGDSGTSTLKDEHDRVARGNQGGIAQKEISFSHPRLEQHKLFGSEISTEILHLIFSRLAPEDVARCSRVCWWWNLAARDPSHWRRACREAWPMDRLFELTLATQIHGSWKKMYIARPRVRTDGVYIYRYQYVRIAGDQAMALVYYYRMFRFYNDRTVVCLTSALRPEIAIRGLKKQWDGDRSRMPAIGTFKLDEANRIVHFEVPQIHPDFPLMKKGTAGYELNLDETHRGAHNRLWLANHYVLSEGDENAVSIDLPVVPFKFISFADFRELVYEYYPDERASLRKRQMLREKEQEKERIQRAGRAGHYLDLIQRQSLDHFHVFTLHRAHDRLAHVRRLSLKLRPQHTLDHVKVVRRWYLPFREAAISALRCGSHALVAHVDTDSPAKTLAQKSQRRRCLLCRSPT
ncbi:F-box protein 7 [Porphyridium purpureum]|uniref:F-box protein 7 n=1 Tax=Porphyridium purpureum TaxID=35688 RepID=A0A5J4YXE2_PORPP|nr:F-box protein 7 [Porphyridium purpureum]|eukprot:POR4220..scf209_3